MKLTTWREKIEKEMNDLHTRSTLKKGLSLLLASLMLGTAFPVGVAAESSADPVADAYTAIISGAGDQAMKTLGEKVRSSKTAAVVTSTPGDTTGEVYYVSPDGSDSNDGTSASSPWQTIDKINETTFEPGDMILFQAGSTWMLDEPLHPLGSGTAEAPIVIGAYGTGEKPHLDAKNVENDTSRAWVYNNGKTSVNKVSSNAIYLENQEYIEIRDLEISNTPDGYDPTSSSTTQKQLRNDRRGIHIVGAVTDKKQVLHGIYLHDLYIHDVFGDAITAREWDASKRVGGIVLETILKDETTGLPVIQSTVSNTLLSGYEPTYFDGVVIENNIMLDNSFSSIAIKQLAKWGVRPNGDKTKAPQYYHTEEQGWYPHRNITIQHNYLDHDGGELAANTVYLTNSKDSVVQYNYCVGAGTSAIELNQTDNTVIQYNEIYKARQKATGADSNGIDPDRNATNALIQYNYIDSCGDGILLCGFNYGSSVVRYNVIKDSESGKRYVNVHGDKGHQYIYNNIFYNSTSKAATFVASSGGSTYLGKSSNHHYIFNNIFYSPKAAARIDDGVATEYSNNVYYGVSTVPAEDTAAVAVDPKLTDVSSVTGGTGKELNIAGFAPAADSPAINAGKAIQEDESGNLPNTVLPVRNGETSTDFAGTTVQTAGTPDAGVLEFVSADTTKGGVNGYVYDPYGARKSGAVVTVTQNDEDFSAATDDNGFFTLYGLAAGSAATISVKADGYEESDAVELNIVSDILKQDLTLGTPTATTGAIKGQVSNTDNVTVTLYNSNGDQVSETTTAADGSFLFQDVAVGEGYKVVFKKEGYNDAAVEDLSVRAAYTTTLDDVKLTKIPEELKFLLKENFDTYEAGTFTGNDTWGVYNGDSNAQKVTIAEENGNKYLSLQHTGDLGTATTRVWNKAALNATGQFTIEARIRQTVLGNATYSRFAIFTADSISDEGAVSKPMADFGFYPKNLFVDNGKNSGSNKTVKYASNPEQWYKIRLEVDMDTDTFDFYVDDTLKRSGCGLRTAGDALNYFSIFGTDKYNGDIQVDYLWVYSGGDGSNTAINELTVDSLDLTYDEATATYTANQVLPYSTESVTVKAALANPLGKVSINGQELGYADDGESVVVPLNAGENSIPIVVTAAGTNVESKTYTLKLTRQNEDLLAYLTGLSIDGITFTPAFEGTDSDVNDFIYDGGTTDTSVHTLTYSVPSPKVQVTVSLNGVNLTAKDNQVELALVKGENTVVASTISGSKDEFKTYTIKINCTEGSEAPQDGYSVSVSGGENAVVGGSVDVALTIESADKEVFNAFDASLTYDPAVLKLNSLSDNAYTADTSAEGTVRIYSYGEQHDLGTVVNANFTVLQETAGSDVTLTSAKADLSENAVENNAPDAAIRNASVSVSTGGYQVVLGEFLSGPSTAASGKDYTFTVADGAHYDYTITAKVNGTDVSDKVIRQDDGSYVLPGEYVTGTLELSATRTAKKYTVTFNGNGAADAAGAAEAVYGTDYTFTLNKADGYSYTVAVQMNGTAYTGMKVENGTYTIPGADISGNVEISVTKEEVLPDTVSVTFTGNAAGDAHGESTAEKGRDYTFTITEAAGATYEVSAKCGENDITVNQQEDKSYQIKGSDITGDLTISINKTTDLQLEVKEYVKLDGKSIFLVIAKETVPDGKTLAYDGSTMYVSDAYKGYACGV